MPGQNGYGNESGKRLSQKERGMVEAMSKKPGKGKKPSAEETRRKMREGSSRKPGKGVKTKGPGGFGG